MENKKSNSVIKPIWLLVKPYWFSRGSRKSKLFLLFILALILLNVYLLVLLNEWRNDFFTALQNYDSLKVAMELFVFLKLAFLVVLAETYIYYLQKNIMLDWRNWMSDHLIHRWLDNRHYYYLQLLDSKTDNPDQRISEDIYLFVNNGMKFVSELLMEVITLVTFVVILWNLSGIVTFVLFEKTWTIHGYLVWAAILYSILGTYLTHYLGKPLIFLNVHQQKYEADLRVQMIRIRTNAESIALYGGELNEYQRLKKHLHQIIHNFRYIIRKEKLWTGMKSGYGQLANVFPVLVSIPRYLAREINLGGLMQSSSAFLRVARSLSYFITYYKEFAEWRAATQRLSLLLESMKISGQQFFQPIHVSKDGDFQTDHLDIYLPDGEILLQDLSLHFFSGKNTVIKGENGVGKSLLLRTIGGIWPFFKGEIYCPEKKDMLFIPQKIYLPVGTLKEAICYPASPENYPDEAVKKMMEKCDLKKWVDELLRLEDWQSMLSIGEQQKLAFVKALLFSPKWLLLDEATSAVPEEVETKLYSVLNEVLQETTLISIAHRSTLDRFHEEFVYLSGGDNRPVGSLLFKNKS